MPPFCHKTHINIYRKYWKVKKEFDKYRFCGYTSPIKDHMEEKMKKILAVFGTVLIVSALFTGCGKKAQPEVKPKETGKARVSVILGKQGDAGIVDASFSGYERAVKELPIEGRYIEQGRDPSKFRALVLEAVENADIVIGTAGNGLIDEMIIAAKEYPDIKFMVLDTPLNQEGIVELPNFLGILCKQNEVSFLTGYLGAKMSKTGKIGIVVGVEYPVLCDFITGYIYGALAANPNIQVAVSASGSWDDQAAAKETALAQFLLGTDVVYCVGAASSFGSLEAAKEQGKWGIGCDTDLAAQFIGIDDKQADVIITSAYKDWGQATYYFIERAISSDPSKIPWGTVEQVGIADGGCKLIKNVIYKKQVPPEIQKEIDDIEAKISNGTLVCPSYFEMTSGEYDTLKKKVAIR
jgi:basic membrane protein A